MKSKIKITLLIITCFTLMGCPPGHFQEYKYTGTELPDDEIAFTRIEYSNETDLSIRVGFYNEFINDKEKGLTALIKSNSDFDLNKNDIIKEIKSSIFGNLNRVDSLPYTARIFAMENTILYKLIIENRNETKMLKKIENDTISIEFTNGKILLFVR